MTTKQVADRFYQLAQQGQWDDIQNELFSQDAVSIEPEGTPWGTVKGLDAIREKGRQFAAMFEEMHSGWCTEPQVGGNYFSVAMGMDVTMKDQGRVNMDEVCVYQVKDGKIVSEQFFYNE
ncbi:MAG: nuclear transport factor 2 family protein [Saprospiraceae bacterium]|nr:nuclear transport factor 2 family protein [Saprospiraceae bacterium]